MIFQPLTFSPKCITCNVSIHAYRRNYQLSAINYLAHIIWLRPLLVLCTIGTPPISVAQCSGRVSDSLQHINPLIYIHAPADSHAEKDGSNAHLPEAARAQGLYPGMREGWRLAPKRSGEFLTAKRKATEALEREASVMDCRPLDKGFLTTSTASASSLSHTKPVARRDAAQHQKRCEAEIGEETQFQGYEAFTPELDKTPSSACLLQAARAKAIRYSSAFLIIILG